MSEVKLQIPQPPDFLFQKERTGNVLNESSVVYLIEKMEAVEHFGMCVYYKGVPYVKKGFPTPEALYALNQVKKLLLEVTKTLKNPFFSVGFLVANKTELCRSFNTVFDKIFGAHKMKEEFMCRSAFNLANFAHSVLLDIGVENSVAREFAFNIAQIIEYDDAYRYRFQDLMQELDVELLRKNTAKEIKRLVQIFKERSTNQVPEKLSSVLSVISILSFFMSKKINKHSSFLKLAAPDNHDRYWMCMRNDHYNYFGQSVKERHELYTYRPTAYETMA